MILVLRQGATAAQVDAVLHRLEASGLRSRAMQGAGRPLIHVLTQDAELPADLLHAEGIETVLHPSGGRPEHLARPFYPYHFINWCIAALALLCALALLAAFLPPGLGPPVDLEHPPERIGPPWFFRGLEQFLMLFPPGLAWLGAALAVLAWVVVFLLPRLDRSRPGSVGRGVVLGLGLAAVVAAIWLSLRGLVW
jgi:quinol-cytochrome oxidoreductase complex cytochrome b subunit